MFFRFSSNIFLLFSTLYINFTLFFLSASPVINIFIIFCIISSTFIQLQRPLVLLDSQTKLCYDLSVKGCDEDTRKGKIPREEAIW